MSESSSLRSPLSDGLDPLCTALHLWTPAAGVSSPVGQPHAPRLGSAYQVGALPAPSGEEEASHEPTPGVWEEEPPRTWTDSEDTRFREGVLHFGTDFRRIQRLLLPELPLRELVSHYYLSRGKGWRPATRREFGGDGEALIGHDAARKRARPCGTVGCMLHDYHAGVHLFAAVEGKRRRLPKHPGPATMHSAKAPRARPASPPLAACADAGAASPPRALPPAARSLSRANSYDDGKASEASTHENPATDARCLAQASSPDDAMPLVLCAAASALDTPRHRPGRAAEAAARPLSERPERVHTKGQCGTVGCQLKDRHAGLHLFDKPAGPRVRMPSARLLASGGGSD